MDSDQALMLFNQHWTLMAGLIVCGSVCEGCVRRKTAAFSNISLVAPGLGKPDFGLGQSFTTY